MKKLKKFNIDYVKLDDIVITSARIDNNTGMSSLEKHKFLYNITHNYNFAFNLEENKFRATFSCKITVTRKEDNEEISINSNFDIAFFFQIDNLKDLIGKGPDYFLDKDLMVSIINIIYPTSRGIIFTRCQGTILKTLILPILPTAEIVTMPLS